MATGIQRGPSVQRSLRAIAHCRPDPDDREDDHLPGAGEDVEADRRVRPGNQEEDHRVVEAAQP